MTLRKAARVRIWSEVIEQNRPVSSVAEHLFEAQGSVERYHDRSHERKINQKHAQTMPRLPSMGTQVMGRRLSHLSSFYETSSRRIQRV